MGRNVEVKVAVPELSEVEGRLSKLEAEDHGIISQADTYFRAQGRLKLRQQSPALTS